MSQVSTILVEDVSEKTGTSDRGPWTRWSLKDGNGDWYSTFEKDVVKPELKGQKIEIEWEQNGNFKNLLRASPVFESPIAARTPEGDADWDLIGLRKTRCALWAAYLPDAASAGFNAWMAAQTDPPGTLDIQNFMVRFGKALVLSAEIDIFHRPPAVEDEDLPF